MRATIALIAILLSAPVVAQQPNILVILADDLGKEGLGFTGNPPAHSTPNLDRLATEGTVYTSAFAEPNCSPTRAALLTGLHPFNNGIDRVIPNGSKTCLDPALPSLARTLSDAGYTTGVAGKWHVCGQLLDRQTHPGEMGFDRYAVLGRQVTKTNDFARYIDPLVVYDTGLVKETGFAPDLFAAWIDDFMATTPGPWFAYWAFNLVHAPFIDPDAMVPGGERQFDDMVAYMDMLIGEVTAGAGNTVIVFLGDNGTDRVLGGGKGTAKDSGTNVPMIVWGLGASEPDHRLVSVVDLHATLAEIAGAIPPATDGVSFLTDTRDHVISFSKTQGGKRISRMVRERQWKIRRERKGESWKLYHLPSDIKEAKPVKSRKGEAGEAFDRLMAHWQDR